MPFDIYAFYESAAKNGMTAVAAASGHKKGTVSGDDIEIPETGTVFRSECVSGAIANAVQYSLIEKSQPTKPYVRSRAGFIRDQTDICRQLVIMSGKINSGQLLNAYADNGNNAQVEAIIAMVATGSVPYFSDKPGGPIPDDAFIMDLAGTTPATVAGSWVELTDPTTNAVLGRNDVYEILGMAAQGAGLIACALSHSGKSNMIGYFPGVPGGDLPGEAVMWYSDQFGTFEGANLPKLVALTNADCDVYASLLVRKVGSSK